MSTVTTGEAVSPSVKKTIGDFVSQGSAGGAISLFVLALISVLKHPNGYNFLLIPYFPFILLLGSVLGAAGGVFIWLIEPIFKLRLGVLVRSIVTVGVIALISAVVSFFQGSPIDLDLLLASLTTGGVIGLPVTILISSNISLWWLVLFGSDRFAAAGWPSLLAGFLFRAASLAGLLISLFFLAWWGSFLSLDWGVSLNPYYIGIAILYFVASCFFAFRPPRGWSLIVAALLLNAPLLLCAFHLVPAVDADTRSLGIIILFFLGLWSAFAICLLFDAGFYPRSENRPVDIPLVNKRM